MEDAAVGAVAMRRCRFDGCYWLFFVVVAAVLLDGQSRDGIGVIDGMPSSAVEGAIVLGCSGGWRMRPLAP